MKYRRVNQFLVCILSAATAGGLGGCGTRSSAQAVSDTAVVAESTAEAETVSSSSEEEESEGSVEQGTKYLENLDYDNAILEFRKVLRKDSKNVKALAGLYSALIAKGDRKEAEAVITEAKAADIDENTMIEEVLDTADMIPDTDAANSVRNAIGTVALEDEYYELAKKAFTAVLENDADNEDAAEGLKQVEKKNKESEKKTNEKKKASSEADNTDSSNAESSGTTGSGGDAAGSPTENDANGSFGNGTVDSSGSGTDSSGESGSETSAYGESGGDADNAEEGTSSSTADDNSDEGGDTSSSDDGTITTTDGEVERPISGVQTEL